MPDWLQCFGSFFEVFLVQKQVAEFGNKFAYGANHTQNEIGV